MKKSGEITVTAVVAQRKVSKLVLDQVSNLLYGEHPTLLAGERLLWRCCPSGLVYLLRGHSVKLGASTSMHKVGKFSILNVA